MLALSRGTWYVQRLIGGRVLKVCPNQRHIGARQSSPGNNLSGQSACSSGRRLKHARYATVDNTSLRRDLLETCHGVEPGTPAILAAGPFAYAWEKNKNNVAHVVCRCREL